MARRVSLPRHAAASYGCISSIYLCRLFLYLRRIEAARGSFRPPVPGKLGKTALARLRGASSLSRGEARRLRLLVAEDAWRLHGAFSAGARQVAGWVEAKNFAALNTWLSAAPAKALAGDFVGPEVITAMLSLAWRNARDLETEQDPLGLSTFDAHRRLAAGVAELGVMPNPGSYEGQDLARMAQQSLGEAFDSGEWSLESPQGLVALEHQVGLCGTWTPSFESRPVQLWTATNTCRTLTLRLNSAAHPTDPIHSGTDAQAGAGLVPEAQDAFPALCALVRRLERQPTTAWRGPAA